MVSFYVLSMFKALIANKKIVFFLLLVFEIKNYNTLLSQNIIRTQKNKKY